VSISKAFAVGAPTVGGAGLGSGTAHTTASFDSTGYTHLVVFTKHEGATTTITPSDNKGSTGWSSLTKISNRAVDSWGQFHWVKIGTPGTGHTVTMTLGASRDYRQINVWLVSATSGEIALVSETTGQSPSDNTAIDAGTLSNAGADSIVSFMSMAEYASGTYTQGAGWSEDFDPNGANFTYGQSRGPETTTSIAAVCTATTSQDWAAFAAAFKEATASGPTIDTQPQNVTVYEGQTANFTVSATTSGGTLSYQWKDDGGNVGTDSNSYTTGAALLSDNGAQITVDVTDDNGTTVSDAATWTVLPAARTAWIRA
jgi:hypothetical protein